MFFPWVFPINPGGVITIVDPPPVRMEPSLRLDSCRRDPPQTFAHRGGKLPPLVTIKGLLEHVGTT